MKTRLICCISLALQLLCVGCTSSGVVNSGQSSVNQVQVKSIDLAGPDERFGDLFVAVQMAGLYRDSKTFADAIPLFSDEKILAGYLHNKNQPGFDLKKFIEDNFAVPLDSSSPFISDPSKNAIEHMNILWDVLTRQPGSVVDNGTLIPIPNAYIVPGGRFREIYYWDSYFTMLGLQASGRWDLIENMVDNFSYLIDTLGYIPNGNRSYYLTRSQPPFYSLMVKLLEEGRGKGTVQKYTPQLQKEYDFWMEGAAALTPASPASRRVVLLPDGSIMNRYWDDRAAPRPESYKEDVDLVNANHLSIEKYRDIRAAAESGWDFSSRWFKDQSNMSSIHTTEIIPVDLNALLYHLEMVLAEAYQQVNNEMLRKKYLGLAQKRKLAVQRYLWSELDGFFHDYDFVARQQTKTKSLAAMFPLYFNMVEPQQAIRVAKCIQQDFLKSGGVTTTLNNTHQQWDAPNGWAPLQWITIKGLQNYQQDGLAKTIRKRWVDVNLHVYRNSGKMVEKYNVYDLGLDAGGGEYPVQDGFGWTNGILLKLLEQQGEPIQRRD